MENKLTIEQLKNYLGTGLKCKVKHRTICNMEVKNPIFSLDSINQRFKCVLFWTHDPSFCDQFGFTGKGFQSNEFKPICYRLSDLDKFIPELGFVPIDKLSEMCDWVSVEFDGSDFVFEFEGDISYDGGYNFERTKQACKNQFQMFQKLFQWHFWPFGDEYFDQGLVIDKLKHGK